MKRHFLIITAFFMLISTTLNAQTINSFFNKYDHDNRFECVSVGRFLFSLALITGKLDKDEKELLASLRKIKVLTSKDELQPEFSSNIMKDFNKVVKRGKFESLVEVREKKEKVKIYIKEKRGFYTDLVIAVQDSDEVNLIWIKGKLTKKIVERLKNENNKEINGITTNINL